MEETKKEPEERVNITRMEFKEPTQTLYCRSNSSVNITRMEFKVFIKKHIVKVYFCVNITRMEFKEEKRTIASKVNECKYNQNGI